MKRFLPVVICLISLAACSSSKQQEHKDAKANTLTSQNTTKNKDIAEAKASRNTLKDSATSTKSEGNTSKDTEKQKLSAVQKLLARLGRGVKVEYTELDKEVLSNDTLVHTRHGDYQIVYSTACLNDSLVAQEMFNYGEAYNKSYRLLHNYQTSIAMRHNGQSNTGMVISKDIFQNKMEKEFLEKAIIKHPQFIGFDEETNEAIFQFLVGVPATDWVVLAGVNLSPRGNIRIIDKWTR